MTFDVEVGERTRSIAIERAGDEGHYRITVDGRAHAVVARRTLDAAVVLTAATLPRKLTPADKLQEDGVLQATKGPAGRSDVPATYELFVAPVGASGEVLVTLDGRTALVTVNGRRTSRRADASSHAHGEQRVVAPMPGRVVRVLVAPGDEVSAKQAVVVVEAMKMENELRAPKAGRIKDVSVGPGTSVEAGRVLVVIE